MLHKKTISSNYNQNSNNKTDENRKKNYQKRISLCKFYKTKFHRGGKRR